MGRYYVTSTIEFAGFIEADSKEEAEEKGYYYDNLEYVCVDEVVVGDNEMECDGCLVDLDIDECECEEEEAGE